MFKNNIIIILIVMLVCSSTLTANNSGRIIYDLPEEVAFKQFGRISAEGLTEEEIAGINSYSFGADTLKLLVIMVHWSDRPSTYSQPTFDSLVFSKNVYPNGSVLDYYEEVSYGDLTIIGDVIDWYDAGSYSTSFSFESLLPAMNSIIDYSQYDGNNDGVVDAITFVRSGNGKEDTGDINDIWSHAYSYVLGSGPGPFDGMMVSRWNTVPETRPLRHPLIPQSFLGVDSLTQINVMVHELAHNLGLPDLYDYDNKLDLGTFYTPNDNNDHPLYDWDIMGYGGYGLTSIGFPITSHFCGWSKEQLGWIEPITLEGEYTDLVIKDIETHSDSSLYLVTIDPALGEYFLLEYRNPQSTATFDKFDSDFSVYFWPQLTFESEPLETGLLITHIDDSVNSAGWGRNNGMPTYPHYTVQVEDAGYNPARDYTTNPEGTYSDSAQWWYPYETRKAATFNNSIPGKEIFSPTTTPNSDGYTGPSGITVRVDSIVGDRLYAYVFNPNTTDYDNDGLAAANDNCPNTFNPSQTDIDFDGIGDSCDSCTDSDNDGFGNPGFTANTCAIDNCPDVSNSDQLDVDADGVGDSCDNCLEVYNPEQIDSDSDGIGDLCEGCCYIDRGNVDGGPDDGTFEGSINIADLVFLVAYMFQGGDEPVCLEEADIDGSGGATPIDITDIVMLVDFMFAGGAAPAICP